MELSNLNREQLEQKKAELQAEYNSFLEKGLKLDMSRGKPGPEQLDLCEGMLTVLSKHEQTRADGIDTRNYGGLEGIASCREMFAELLGVSAANVIAGGNSSLTMMYDTLLRLWVFGAPE